MIFINAPIGIGKTSLTRILTKDLGTKGFYEDVENIPMLKEFYADGNKSRNDLSFALQIAFLNYRFPHGGSQPPVCQFQQIQCLF